MFRLVWQVRYERIRISVSEDPFPPLGIYQANIDNRERKEIYGTAERPVSGFCVLSSTLCALSLPHNLESIKFLTIVLLFLVSQTMAFVFERTTQSRLNSNKRLFKPHEVEFRQNALKISRSAYEYFEFRMLPNFRQLSPTFPEPPRGTRFGN